MGGRPMRQMGALAVLAVSACASPPAHGQQPLRIAQPQSPIATSVLVSPGSALVYVSGTVPDVADPAAPAGTVARFGDTETQTRSILARIEQALAAHGLALADVVMMRVFLVAPPGQQQMDFAGMMRAYRERFGTDRQPNRPARSTMQVAGLVDPGWLVEIEVTAARARK